MYNIRWSDFIRVTLRHVRVRAWISSSKRPAEVSRRGEWGKIARCEKQRRSLIGNLRSARGVGFNEAMAIRDEMKLVKALTAALITFRRTRRAKSARATSFPIIRRMQNSENVPSHVEYFRDTPLTAHRSMASRHLAFMRFLRERVPQDRHAVIPISIDWRTRRFDVLFFATIKLNFARGIGSSRRSKRVIRTFAWECLENLYHTACNSVSS